MGPCTLGVWVPAYSPSFGECPSLNDSLPPSYNETIGYVDIIRIYIVLNRVDRVQWEVLKKGDRALIQGDNEHCKR